MLANYREWPYRWLKRLPNWLPSSCALCNATHAKAICDDCETQYFHHSRHRCRCCAVYLPTLTSGVCGGCLAHIPAFDATIVASDYTPPIDQLVLALKFGSRLALAPVFAQTLCDAILKNQSTLPMPDALTAVPLGPLRLRERGFNQALEIGKPLSRMLGLNFMPRLVMRLRDTQAQSQLHSKDRHANLRNAFSVTQNHMDWIRGRHIGVVDDVITTGETLNELAATLKRFGAARVTNYVFARPLPK